MATKGNIVNEGKSKGATCIGPVRSYAVGRFGRRKVFQTGCWVEERKWSTARLYSDQ